MILHWQNKFQSGISMGFSMIPIHILSSHITLPIENNKPFTLDTLDTQVYIWYFPKVSAISRCNTATPVRPPPSSFGISYYIRGSKQFLFLTLFLWGEGALDAHPPIIFCYISLQSDTNAFKWLDNSFMTIIHKKKHWSSVCNKVAQYWSNSFIPKCIFTIDSLCNSFFLVNFIFQQEIIKKDI